MQITSSDQLTEYRKQVRLERNLRDEHGTDVRLFGIFLDMREHKPVVLFTKITKKYIYSESEKKYGFGQIRENIFTLFTTENEAWRFYYSKLIEMREMVEEHLKTIEKAEILVDQKMKENPEYFI